MQFITLFALPSKHFSNCRCHNINNDNPCCRLQFWNVNAARDDSDCIYNYSNTDKPLYNGLPTLA